MIPGKHAKATLRCLRPRNSAWMARGFALQSGCTTQRGAIRQRFPQLTSAGVRPICLPVARGCRPGLLLNKMSVTRAALVWPKWLIPAEEVKEESTFRMASGAEVENLVANGCTVPHVLYFQTNWCGPCKILSRQLQGLAVELGSSRVRVLKIDVDVEREFASSLQVRKLPTLLFLGPNLGKPALRTQGLLSPPLLRDIVTSKCLHLGNSLHDSWHL